MRSKACEVTVKHLLEGRRATARAAVQLRSPERGKCIFTQS